MVASYIYYGIPGAQYVELGPDFDSKRAKNFYNIPTPPPATTNPGAGWSTPATPPPQPPPPQPASPPEPAMFSVAPFTLFAVGEVAASRVVLARYPFVRTPTGTQPFLFFADLLGAGTTFTVADYKNEFKVTVPEFLVGRFAVKLEWRRGAMRVDTWCRGTSNPTATASLGAMQVSFEPSKIIIGW